MKRRWWLAAVGGAALMVVVGAGVVMAQTPTPGAGTATSFLDRVAQKLGITTPKLQSAINSAANDQIDAMVKSGKLTQQQADQLKQRIAQGKGPGLGGPFFGRDFGHEMRGPKFGFALGAEMDKLAAFIGVSTTQLKTELQASNATLATVAQAHVKSRADLKNFITNEAKTRLDQAVKDGKLTQQQETSMLSMLTSNLDALIDGKLPLWGRGDRGMMPGMPHMEPEAPETPGMGARFDVPAPAGSAMSVLESS